ncbi:polynucleotide kinase 3'-phosphatase [Megachile rotundata]|uniref:polynucleotide kinase 3'-phosphatase n=1 Tax=Megachile rotundata TaxID=143995 RepID=UPI003FD31EA4
MKQAKSCYLKSNDKTLKTVYLPHQEPIIVGRNPDTNITDTQCPRQQVRLCADYEEHKVTIQQIGKRSCGFNGFKTRKDVKFIGTHNDCLEILYGKYVYQIEFNPPPPKPCLPEKRIREPEACDDAAKYSYKIPKVESDDIDSKEQIQGQIEKKHKKNTDGILKYINRKTNSENMSDQVGEGTWESINSGALLIYTSQGVEGRSKIAAYDMDGTLITTKSGLVFPKDYDDWQLLYSDIPNKLRELHKSSYKIVIFTNQASIGSGRLNTNSFKNKLKNVVQKIGVPMQVFIATGNSIYRKPAPGMWHKLQEYNDSVIIDKENSFYVGDAAGRIKNWAPGKKKDHSLADRLLALNLGLKFYTPEEHFRGHGQAQYMMPGFNPTDLSNKDICTGASLTSSNQEVILMVGCPGSGKSHFVKNHLNHYECVNRDSLGSWQKCIKMMEKHLMEKRSVVVDNTNPDCASRQRYIEVAKRYNVSVRCFIMSISVDHAKHNNKFRELTDPSHAKISEIIINSYMNNYQLPTLDEGFAEIVHINFVPSFQKEEDRKLYEMYLLEH